MESVTTQDSQALLPQLAEAREKLDGLVRDLRAIDVELEALTTERRQHRLLEDACAALEELRQMRVSMQQAASIVETSVHSELNQTEAELNKSVQAVVEDTPQEQKPDEAKPA